MANLFNKKKSVSPKKKPMVSSSNAAPSKKANVSGIKNSAEVTKIPGKPNVNPNEPATERNEGEPVVHLDGKAPVIKLKKESRNPNWKTNIPLFLYMFLIVTYGLIVLYSVSAPVGYVNSKFTTSGFFAMSQVQFTIGGLVIAIALNFIPVDWLKNKFIMFSAYGVSLALIVATAIIGKDLGQGARRWLAFGGFYFQPSEVFKIGLVIALAYYRIWINNMIENGKIKPRNKKWEALCYAFFEFILPAGAIIVPAALVLVQPHFSCFLILGTVTFVCFLVSGINSRSWVIGVGVILLVAMFAGGIVMLVPSVREKVTDKVTSNFAHVFKRFSIYGQDDEEELTDAQKDEALQVTRAKDAIGTGGFSGVGLGSSRSKYSYVSESHNDYIYSIYVEETGFIGGTLLIIFYLVFLLLGLMVAYRAKDVFCRIIATGYTFLIVLEAMWNIGVELTVLPSTGITLPFFSYGGTAQVLLLVAYGMVLCVARSGVSYKEKDGNN